MTDKYATGSYYVDYFDIRGNRLKQFRTHHTSLEEARRAAEAVIVDNAEIASARGQRVVFNTIDKGRV
jgi:hypothetical protein